MLYLIRKLIFSAQKFNMYNIEYSNYKGKFFPY